MELIQEIGKRQYGTSMRNFGLFQCPVCSVQVEKSLSHGKRDKNCGSKECRKVTFVPNKNVAIKNTKHGYATDPNFRTFSRIHSAMIQRCNNKNNSRYASYGGSGITVCDRWKDLTNFAIDMFPTYKSLAVLGDGTKSMRPSIDRIDPFRNYEPSNCQWITYGENSSKDKKVPVVRMDMDYNILETYNSMTDASEFEMPYGAKTIKASLSNIHDCCNGKRNEHLGYIWAYATSKTSMQKHNITQ
jgi:hypothetical protein